MGSCCSSCIKCLKKNEINLGDKKVTKEENIEKNTKNDNYEDRLVIENKTYQVHGDNKEIPSVPNKKSNAGRDTGSNSSSFKNERILDDSM